MLVKVPIVRHVLFELYLVATHVFATTVEENKPRGAGTLIDGTYIRHGMLITAENDATGATGPGHSGPDIQSRPNAF